MGRKPEKQQPIQPSQEGQEKKNMKNTSKRIKKTDRNIQLLQEKHSLEQAINAPIQIEQKFKDKLENEWFGNEVSESLIIFFGNEGLIITKTDAGKRSKESNSPNRQLQSDRAHIKRLKMNYKKSLEEKMTDILTQYQFKADTYNLLLNNDSSKQFIIPSYITNTTTVKGLKIVASFISKRFLPVFKEMINLLNQNSGSIVEYFVQYSEKFEMIFQAQTIKEIFDRDLQPLHRNKISKEEADLILRPLPKLTKYELSESRLKSMEKNTWLKNIIEGIQQRVIL